MNSVKEKKRAAKLSIGSNITLIISKLSVGVFTGSISIISEAIHSLTDLFAAILAFFSIKAAAEPADAEHPFGHGKFEDLSGLIEGLLILLAGGVIIHEAINKISHPVNETIDATLGIYVMLFSVIINIFVSNHLHRVAKKTDSIALLADAEHLKVDVYTSFGVLAGLLAIKITHLHILDPIIAILVAIFIIKAGLDISFKAGENLLDTALPENEILLIKNSISKHMPDKIVKFKDLKTRKAGANRHVELTLVIPAEYTVKEGHDICDALEKDFIQQVNNLKTSIHIEPCDSECQSCNYFYKFQNSCVEVKSSF